MRKAIHKLAESKNLGFETTKEVMDEIMGGNAVQTQMSPFLTALRMKGETIDKIMACATVMCDKAVGLSPPFPAIDIAGIRGNEVETFNISTINAFVAATGGIRVAKHGNRGVSSKSGAVNVLERLGVELTLTAQQTETTLESTRMYFLFAPVYHSSVKYAAPVKREIEIRSIFNILSPLSNPVGAFMQLLGVYNRDLVGPLAQVLANLGVIRGVMICGKDGLDETILTGPTHVCEIRYEKIVAHDTAPEELGLVVCSLGELIGGTPKESTKITRNILSESLKGPKRDVMVLNTAISLYPGINGCTVRDYIKAAQGIVNFGAAMTKMGEFTQATKKAVGKVKAS